MSIASEISRLQSAKADIKTAIEAKGVTVPSSTTLDNYDTLIGQISGGSSSWTKIAENDFTVSTTSTSQTSVGTISAGSAVVTKDKTIYIRVRDKAGKRNGYFLGSDAYFLNYNKANNSTTTLNIGGRMTITCNSSGKYSVNASGYGVFGYSIANDGTVTIYSRYNSSNSRTIDGTYHVEVYALSFPDGISPFA